MRWTGLVVVSIFSHLLSRPQRSSAADIVISRSLGGRRTHHRCLCDVPCDRRGVRQNREQIETAREVSAPRHGAPKFELHAPVARC